jgi:ribonuclease HI
MNQASSNQTINIYCDGASRGNPGISGAGVVITGFLDKNLSIEKQLAIFLGVKTNNEAEYLALLLALKLILQIKEQQLKNNDLMVCEMVFNMDSLLVVQQMSGNWKIKEKRMQDLANQCWDVLKKIAWPAKFMHITRDLNQQADWLANQAMDLGCKAKG